MEKWRSLTQAPVGNHNMRLTLALLPSPFAPVLDCHRLVGFNHIGNLQFRINLIFKIQREQMQFKAHLLGHLILLQVFVIGTSDVHMHAFPFCCILHSHLYFVIFHVMNFHCIHSSKKEPGIIKKQIYLSAKLETAGFSFSLRL